MCCGSMTFPESLPRFQITDAAGLLAVGLPAYALGTWAHYATTPDGWVRLGRVSGRGQRFLTLRVEDFDRGIECGLFLVA